MIWNCPVCGKAFDVLWPHLWAYKKNSKFVCSWGCLRAYEKEGKEMDKRQKVPDEAKKAAIAAALEGKDPYEPLRPYTSNPKSLWTYMKQQLRKSDPETAAKLPDLRYRKQEKTVSLADAMTGMQNAADAFFGACEDAGLRLNAETPEAPKVVTVTKVEAVPEITRPVVYDGMTVREIEGGFGRYRRSDVNGSIYIDFEYTEGADVMSLTVKQWRSFLVEMDNAAKILGVEL